MSRVGRLGGLATVVAVAAALGARGAAADGGRVCATGDLGALRITLFTYPTPIRVGMMELSVLVQDARTGTPQPHAGVHFRVQTPGGGSEPLELEARVGAAENRLLHASTLRLSAAGELTIEALVDATDSAGSLRCEAAVLEAESLLLARWPLLLLPPACIALFASHQILLHRQAARRTRLRRSTPPPLS